MEQVWNIEGMKCDGCVTKVQQALEALPEVTEVSVSLQTGVARVETGMRLSPDEVDRAVTNAGHFTLRTV